MEKVKGRTFILCNSNNCEGDDALDVLELVVPFVTKIAMDHGNPASVEALRVLLSSGFIESKEVPTTKLTLV